MANLDKSRFAFLAWLYEYAFPENGRVDSFEEGNTTPLKTTAWEASIAVALAGAIFLLFFGLKNKIPTPLSDSYTRNAANDSTRLFASALRNGVKCQKRREKN